MAANAEALRLPAPQFGGQVPEGLQGIRLPVVELPHIATWEEAYREGVGEVSPLIACALYKIFDATNTHPDVVSTRKGIASLVSAGLLGEKLRDHYSASLEGEQPVRLSRLRVDPSDPITAGEISRRAEERLNNLLDTGGMRFKAEETLRILLFPDSQDTRFSRLSAGNRELMKEEVAGQTLKAALGIAGGNLASANLKYPDKILSKAIEGKGRRDPRKAVGKAGDILLPCLFREPDDTPSFPQFSSLPEAKAVRRYWQGNFEGKSPAGKKRRPLAFEGNGETERYFVLMNSEGDGSSKLVPISAVSEKLHDELAVRFGRIEEELGEEAVLNISGEPFGGQSEEETPFWDRLTARARLALVYLACHENLSTGEKAELLSNDPYLTLVLSELPTIFQGLFSSYLPVNARLFHTGKSIAESAEEYARCRLGFIRSEAGKAVWGIRNFFRPRSRVWVEDADRRLSGVRRVIYAGATGALALAPVVPLFEMQRHFSPQGPYPAGPTEGGGLIQPLQTYDTVYLAKDCSPAPTPCFIDAQAAVDSLNPGGTVKAVGGVFSDLYPDEYFGQQTVVDVENKDLTIRGGYPENFSGPPNRNNPTVFDPHKEGRGILAMNSSLTLENITIREGKIAGNGGGLYGLYSRVIGTNLTVLDSQAGSGGGIYLEETHGGSASDITNLKCLRNTAANQGGCIFLNKHSGEVTNADIYTNTAGFDASAVMAFVSSPTLVHITIADNQVTGQAAGAALTGGPNSWPNIYDGMFDDNVSSDNVSSDGTARSVRGADGGGINLYYARVDEGENPGPEVSRHYVIIGGEPNFVNPAAGDYHIGQGSIGIGTGGWFAGSDYDGNLWGNRADLGAFKGPEQNTPTPTNTPTATGTSTATATDTPTWTPTATSTDTPTVPPTPTDTPTTPPDTSTASPTTPPTVSPTPPPTDTSTASPTTPPTVSPTPPSTDTPTASPTPLPTTPPSTDTPTASPTPLPTTPPPTVPPPPTPPPPTPPPPTTPPPTATETEMPTATGTSTATATDTPTWTSTATPTPTAIVTPTPTGYVVYIPSVLKNYPDEREQKKEIYHHYLPLVMKE